MPSMDQMDQVLDLEMNLQLLVRYETSLKLNLIDSKGEPMIKESEKRDREVHFLLLECTTDKYELNWNIFKKIWSNYRKPALKFENWTITDFDDCL